MKEIRMAIKDGKCKEKEPNCGEIKTRNVIAESITNIADLVRELVDVKSQLKSLSKRLDKLEGGK